MILLPCWRQIAIDTGEKPIVVVAREFADLFRGVSYVQPDIVNAHWYANVPEVSAMCRLKYPEGFTITQCHGNGWSTSESLAPTFGEAMRKKAGFVGDYHSLPLVFDRRNPEREAALVARVMRGLPSDKPLLLYNFTGISSRLPAGQFVIRRIRNASRDFTLINLGCLKATRVYDLLGLYDVAAGLITIDTATLHLAAASKVPMLAYCRGGWSTAVPRPDAMKVWYKNAHLELDAVNHFIDTLAK